MCPLLIAARMHVCDPGPFALCHAPAERETGRSRGFGFVVMNADEASNAAQQLNGTDFMCVLCFPHTQHTPCAACMRAQLLAKLKGH